MPLSFAAPSFVEPGVHVQKFHPMGCRIPKVFHISAAYHLPSVPLFHCICFDSHFGQAVQSYSLLNGWGTTSRVFLPPPPLIPHKASVGHAGQVFPLRCVCVLFYEITYSHLPWTLTSFVPASVLLWSSAFFAHCITCAAQLNKASSNEIHPPGKMRNAPLTRKRTDWELMDRHDFNNLCIFLRI